MGLSDKAMEKAGDAAVGILDGLTKNIKPENRVSEFIGTAMPKLFASKEEYGFENLIGFLTKIMMAQGNHDPSFTATRLLELYNDLGAFFVEVSQPGIEEAEVVEEAEDDNNTDQTG